MRRRFRPNVSQGGNEDTDKTQRCSSSNTTLSNGDQDTSQVGSENATARRRSRFKPSVSVPRSRPPATVPEARDSTPINSASEKDKAWAGQDSHGGSPSTGSVNASDRCMPKDRASTGTVSVVDDGDRRLVNTNSKNASSLYNDVEGSIVPQKEVPQNAANELLVDLVDAAVLDETTPSENTDSNALNESSSELNVDTSETCTTKSDSLSLPVTLTAPSVTVTSSRLPKDTAGPVLEKTSQSSSRRARIKPKISQRPRSTVQGRSTVVQEKTVQSHTEDEITSQSVMTQGETTPSASTTESPRTTQLDASSCEQSASITAPTRQSHNTPIPTPPLLMTECAPVEAQSTATSSQGRRRRAVPNLNALSRRRSHLTSVSEDETMSDAESSRKQNDASASVRNMQQGNVLAAATDGTPSTGRPADVEDTEITESRKRKVSESDGAAADATDGTSGKKKEPGSSKRRLTAARLKVGKDGVDPARMTMSDLIYYNPKSNPLKSSVEEKEKRRRHSERAEGSVVGSPTRSISGSQSPRNDPTLIACDNPSVTGATDSLENDPSVPDSIGASSEGANVAPQVKIAADGSIVLDEESLTIMKSPEATRLDDSDVVYEDSNTVPFSVTKKRTKSKMWQTEETLHFYKVLSQVGTDFSMMALMFPNRTRTELKRKFKKEEKRNIILIEKALKADVPLDEELFKKPDAEENEETIAGLQSNENEQSTSNLSLDA